MFFKQRELMCDIGKILWFLKGYCILCEKRRHQGFD